MKRAFNSVYLALAVLALSLALAFQNCNRTQFKTESQTSQQSSTQAAEIVASPMPTSAPAPTPAPPSIPAPAPQPPSEPKVYSTCQSETVVEPCPSQTPNCTCTDTLPSGTFDSAELVHPQSTDPTNPDGSYDKGPQCLTGGSAAHSGTVASPTYGVCYHFCSVYAKCINGSWQQFYVTW